ncbi:MAG: hypothetical protein ACXWBN_20505, partial [Acidimicrobiales bacterium]
EPAVGASVVDGNVRAGVASVTHSRSASGPGRLTSSVVGVDPLTGMPHASGLRVSISRSSGPRPGPGVASGSVQRDDPPKGDARDGQL